MATFSHFVATKMRPRLLSRHAAVSRIASLQRNGLVRVSTPSISFVCFDNFPMLPVVKPGISKFDTFGHL